MVEWWEDNWQWAVGTTVGVLGLFAAAIALRRQRQPKQLDYRIVANVPILANDAGYLDADLTVNYKNTRVANPHVLTMRIINTGKLSIRPEDHERPIRILFVNAPMLSAFIGEVSNFLIKAELKAETEFGFQDVSNTLDVLPGLINRCEWVDVQILTDGKPEGISVLSRFADQTRDMREIGQPSSRWSRMATGATGVLIGALAAVVSSAILSAFS